MPTPTQIQGQGQVQVATITNDRLADDQITNVKVNSAAGILYSKLNLTGGIVDSDVNAAAAIVYSKLDLSNSIVNTDVSATAAIAYSKLNLSNSIVDSDINVAAGIAFSKLASLPSANILVGGPTNVVTAVSMTGDVTIDDTGATTIGTGKVTNSMLAGSITDSKLASSYVYADGTRAMTGNLQMGGNLITNLASPVSNQDAVNKTYVDNAIAGLEWKSPVVTRNLVGNANVAALNALGALAGNAYVVTSAGTLTRGSVSVNAGDLVEDNGSIWVKLYANVTGFVPAGVRAILSKATTLLAPYTDGTDNNKIVSFSGASNTGTDTGDAQDRASVLVDDTNDLGYNLHNAYVFDIGIGTVAQGSWIQWNGAAQITAGNGLSKTGNTLDVNISSHGVVIVTDNLETSGSQMAGFGLAVGASVWQLKVNPDAIGGANLSRSISSTANGVAVKIDNSTIQENGSLQLTVNGANVSNVNALTLNSLSSTDFLRTTASSDLLTGNTLTIDSGATFSIASGATWNLGGTTVTATAAQLNGLGTFVVREVPTGAVDGSNDTFTLANTPLSGSEEVFVNGILQDVGAPNDYVITGAVITFNAGAVPQAGSKVRVNYRY